MTKKVTCSVCGGANVQRVHWVRANTAEVLEQMFDDGACPRLLADTWCEDCQDHTELVAPPRAAAKERAVS